ncbi:hypothetical protein J7J18_03600 [bacterium]|nr:hypothetical protein [bacterium]
MEIWIEMSMRMEDAFGYDMEVVDVELCVKREDTNAVSRFRLQRYAAMLFDEYEDFKEWVDFWKAVADRINAQIYVDDGVKEMLKKLRELDE